MPWRLRAKAEIDNFGRIHFLVLRFEYRKVDALLGRNGLANIDRFLSHKHLFTLSSLLTYRLLRFLDSLRLWFECSVFSSPVLLDLHLSSHFASRHRLALAFLYYIDKKSCLSSRKIVFLALTIRTSLTEFIVTYLLELFLRLGFFNLFKQVFYLLIFHGSKDRSSLHLRFLRR